MKKYIIILLTLLFMSISGAASAQSYSVMEGPWFSTPENWKPENVAKALVDDLRGFPGAFWENLKFLKNEKLQTDSGTAYYIEVFNPADDAVIALIGNKNVVSTENDDETIVTFYHVHDKNGQYIIPGSHRLHAVYQGTLNHKKLTLIEFDEMVSPSHTESGSKKVEFNRMVYAIQFDNSAIKSKRLATKTMNSCEDIQACEAELSNSVESLSDKKEFALSSKINCKRVAPEKDKVSPSFVCIKK